MRLAYIRFVQVGKRAGFTAILRCRDRAACRGRWDDQAKGEWPLVEADYPTPHWLLETS